MRNSMTMLAHMAPVAYRSTTRASVKVRGRLTLIGLVSRSLAFGPLDMCESMRARRGAQDPQTHHLHMTISTIRMIGITLLGHEGRDDHTTQLI
jgi:hypothetical protein